MKGNMHQACTRQGVPNRCSMCSIHNMCSLRGLKLLKWLIVPHLGKAKSVWVRKNNRKPSFIEGTLWWHTMFCNNCGALCESVFLLGELGNI